ncbi:unnamed protein product [Schistosoma turkestanicum]|nr:unnamed protein product [Schistosoma turkestanicum]
MKSILNLLKRLCLDAEWGDIVHSVMDGNLPSVLRQIFLNGSTHFTPHLSLFAMETITNYLYTYPSRISTMQDKNITSDILKALTEQPLPQNRDFLVQLPALLNTLALNSRGIEAILSSGVISLYLNTLVSPEYLSTMKTKRVREFISQIPYDMNCNSGQNLSNSLTASQMSNAIQELLRSHTELKPVVFKCVISCLRHVVSLGKTPATLLSESVSCNATAFNILSSSTRNSSNFGLRSFAEVAGSEPPSHQRQDTSGGGGTSQSMPNAPLGLSNNMQNAIGTNEDDDVVMLSGGEDEDDYNSDIDDVNEASQQTHSGCETVQTGTIVSSGGASVPMASLESLECEKMSVGSDPSTTATTTTAYTEGSSVTPNVFLPDFMLNMCKFLEKLLPFGSHTTEAMCPQFVSQGGLQVLCDLIRMPGLPYDFPVSATCASLCKIFEDLANSVNLTDVTKPLFQCLEVSLNKLTILHTSNYPMNSLLLREYLSGERDVLHELVVIASVVCILVQMIEHIKSEIRMSLASSWLSQNCLKTLGRLYLGVSWEAGIILKVLFGDKTINESDMLNGIKIPQHLLNSFNKSLESDPTLSNKIKNIPCEPMPQFVEALHMYSLITQSISPTTDNQLAFISQHPELIKPLNRILHVTSFLINSVTELFTALGRFFSNRTQINYRRRRTTLFPNELIPNEMKSRALVQVADVLSIAYAWEPASMNRNHKATAILNYAIRYASIRLTNLLLHDSVQRNSDLGMINAFFKLNGITLYFGLFRQLISFDLNDPAIRKPLSIVLEEWLICADRMSNADFCAPSNSDSNNQRTTNTDTEAQALNVKKITARVHQCMIPALAQLCSRTDLQDLLSRKAVEHLLSMLVTIVPYIFNSDNKQRLMEAESMSAAHSSSSSSNWDKTVIGRPSNLPSTENLIEVNPSTLHQTTPTPPSIQPSMPQETPNMFVSGSDRLNESQIPSSESPLEETDNSSQWDKTVIGRPSNLPSTENLIEVNPSTLHQPTPPPSIQPSMPQETPNMFVSGSDRINESQIPSSESPLEETDNSSQSTAIAQDLSTNTATTTTTTAAAATATPDVTSLSVVDHQSANQSNAIDNNTPVNMYFDVEANVSSDDVIRDADALQLMEEMGFARDLAIVALEQTGWNANEAVNLVIATSAHDLMQNANPSLISGLRRGRASRRAQRRRTFVAGGGNTTTTTTTTNESSPLITDVDNSQYQTDVYDHLTEFIDNFNPNEQMDTLINPDCSSLPSHEITITSSSNNNNNNNENISTAKRSNLSKFPLVMMELCNEKTYNEARESLKQNVFKTCYAIAKRHQSYQILHQIAELFISNGEHERYIDELFDVVTTHLKTYLNVSPTHQTYHKSENAENHEFVIIHEKEHQTVGLHLIALLFTRSPLVCACLAWTHKLPSVLIQFVSDCDIPNKLTTPSPPQATTTTTTSSDNSTSGGNNVTQMEVDEFPTNAPYHSNVISESDYYKTLTLAFLVLDQYERSIQALRLRQECVKLYASSHNWHWFDNQAMLWHPYANESMRIIDKSFHKGDLCACCDIGRRPYTIEFPTMTQINLVSMHRRPVMLFPSFTDNTEIDHEVLATQMTPYELGLINTTLPECLNSIERSKLCHALLTHFRVALKKSTTSDQSHLMKSQVTAAVAADDDATQLSPIPSDCLNAMFRLMLRLCFTSYENATELAEADILTMLFSYPHTREFSPEFSSFVGALISEIFDDTSTIDRILKEIFIRMSRSGMPNVFMGIDAGPRACRDLFYLLSLCTPLLAKDRERAVRLITETFSLSLSDSDIQSKIYPKTYIVEESTPTGVDVSTDRSSMISFPLSSRQKHLLAQLMDLIMCSSWKSKGNHYVTGLHHVDEFESPRNDSVTTESIQPPLSNTGTMIWGTGTTTTQSANRPDYHISTENSTTHLTRSSELNKQTDFVVLGKLDAMRYLIDLVGAYKSVGEFVAMYKHKHSMEHTNNTTITGKSNIDVLPPKCSFISYLFSHQLNDSDTAESTMSLLKNLILISSESIQGVIISEFKASLGRVANRHYPIVSSDDNNTKTEIISPLKNDRIASHMMFLMRILSLPSPLINRVLRLLYKRRIPADIAKLIAVVDYNLPNTQFTISIMLHALESLTLVDRQYTKFNSQAKRLTNNNSTGRQVNHVATSVVSNDESGDIEMRPTNSAETSSSIITDSISQNAMLQTISSSEQRTDVSLDQGTTNISSSSTIPGSDHATNTSRDFETDSDDDDDDDDVTMSDQQEFSHPVRNDVESTFDRPSLILSSTTTQGGSASSSLNRVLNDVLAAQADMVINSDHHNENVVHHQPWRSVGNGDQETRSVIFVYDDEDEGSSGQGAEGNNSQEEDEDDEEEEEEEDDDDVLGEDEEEEDDDDDDGEDDDQDDEDAENDPDVEGDDGDVDVSGEDEEVAFVLSRSRRHVNRTRPSGLSSPRRRRRPNASISVTVTTSRANSDRNQNAESHDDDGNLHTEGADIVLHDDTHVEDDGSFGDDDDIDTFGRDDDDDDTTRDDVAIISSDLPGVIFPTDNRGSHGSHSVAAVVEETLRRVVAPPLNVISSNGLRELGTNSLSALNVHSRGGSSGNWDYLLPAFTNLIARQSSRHIPIDGDSNLPTSTTIFRFGPEASVFVGGNNATRLGSGVNFVYSSNSQLAPNTSQSAQILPAATLANQHPLLQVPITTGANSTLSTINTGISSHSTPLNNISGLRVFGVLPRPQNVPPHYGTRHRITGSSGSHVSSGLTGLRHHTTFSRIFNTDSEPDTVNSGGSNNLSRSQLATDVSSLSLNRPIIADAVSMSPVNRVFYVPPSIPQQQQYPPSYGSRHRFPGTTVSHLPSTSGSGSRHPTTTFSRSCNAESEPDSNNPNEYSSSGSQIGCQITTDARDNRSGPEANALVWTMLTSLAEDQPSPVNSALTAAIFSRFLSQGQTSRSQPGIMDIRSRGLTPYAGYALPPHYRRWTNLSRMLFGHEIMDLILFGRYHIYKVLEQKRHELFNLRIAENEVVCSPEVTSSLNEPTVAAPALASTNENVTESAETFVTFATPLVTCVSTSENAGYSQESSIDLQQPQQTVDAIDGVETINQINPDVCVVSEASEISISSELSAVNPTISSGQNESEPTNPVTSNDTPATTTTTTTATPVTTTDTSTAPPPPPSSATRSLVMTDEETIQSLVEGGMDPSFLDALPEEMRQEVIADHRYARQVQQRINSMSLPVHINSEWLTGLPPHIQEEVLAQFRQEQQQQQQQSSTQQPSTTTTTSTSGETSTTDQSNAPPTTTTTTTTQNATDSSNTAFLVSLPPSVLREVLADMDESQLETLPQYLVVEANRLRREHEERYARAVQNGIFAHSNDSRPYHIWRNFTTNSGLLSGSGFGVGGGGSGGGGGGGQGRWIVRFHSNDQIVVHPNHIDSGTALNLNNALGIRTMAGLSSRELIDHEGLTCIIVLLVASSSGANQRQNIIPTVKKVLRNLSCHSATRNWIVSTIISLFNGLSEKPSPHIQLTSPNFISNIEECEPIPSTSNDLGGISSSSTITASESEFQYSTRPMSNHTLFHTGFEAALGCWVRIFHPIPQNQTHTSPYLHSDSNTVVCKDTSSVTPIRYIIHPQAAVSVASVLLETLNELTRAFPSHFYPSEVCQSAGTSHSTDIVYTSFWDIFNRLSQSNLTSTNVGSTPTTATSTRSVTRRTKTSSSSRKRPVSISDKQQTMDSESKTSNNQPCHRLSSSSATTTTATTTTTTTTSEPLSSSSYSAVDVLDNTSMMKEITSDVQYTNSNNNPKSLIQTNTPMNCFTALSELLCHQLLHDRPSHQERLITILAGIVKDFLLSQSHSNISVAQSTTHSTNLVAPPPTTVNTILTDTNQQNPTDLSSQQQQQQQPTIEVQSTQIVENTPTSMPENQSASSSSASTSTEPPISNYSSSTTTTSSSSTNNNLMNPLRSQVIETLCQLVLVPKFSEAARIMTTQLITDLAHANQTMKELILRLLSITAGQLISIISDQLQCLVSEVDKRLKLKPFDSLSKDDPYKPSTSRYAPEISRISSYDVLPDRFGIPGQMVIVSSSSSNNNDTRTQSTMKFSDLQLNSSEVFTSPNNDQCRLRGILGLMLRVAAGDSSLIGSNPIPVTSDDLLLSVPGINEFWNHLCQAFEKLQALNDQNAVLLLQPLLEVFCLAHIHLVKETILLRQRSTNSRSSRTNHSCSSAGTLSLIDMVPLLHMCVDSASNSDVDANKASTTDHLGHLYFDLGGPQSPNSSGVTTGEDDLPATECTLASCSATTTTTTSQSPFSRNPIIEFADKYRRGLSQVLRQYGANIGESPFAVFLAYPRVLDFDVKRRFFRQQLQSLSNRSTSSNRYDDDPITVSRDRIFEDSYARLHRKSVNEWKHKFVIRFQNEEGQDAGGPLREWFLLMSREIFNPNYCLFRVSPADRVTYTINPSSYINSNHLSYFKFVGRFIAKAINDNKLLECYFTRAFYKHILGVPVKCSDLESEDYEFFKGLEFLLSHNVSDLGYELTFSTEINEFGKTDTRDLIENGQNVPVTEANKKEYVRLVCQERMTGAIRQQLDAFLHGFYDIIPKRMISIFNEQELELLISGLPNIDIVDLKANTTYSKYQPNSPQIEWFWQALESFDQEDLARFLQFVTGTSKVPLGGFVNLEGMHGPTKFQISRASVSSTNHLPSAHTCFNTLVLPAYESYEQLRSRLLMAIRECSEGYGMA